MNGVPMSRVWQLYGEIMDVTSEAEAIRLVGGQLQDRQDELSSPPGVKNCQIIQEFAIAYLSRGKAKYYDLIRVNAFNNKAIAPNEVNDVEEKLAKAESVVLACFLGGHDFTIVREGSAYALFQAWEDQFHVFPKLNPNDANHNIIGHGPATLRLINEQLANIKKKTGCNEEVSSKPVKF